MSDLRLNSTLSQSWQRELVRALVNLAYTTYTRLTICPYLLIRCYYIIKRKEKEKKYKYWLRGIWRFMTVVGCGFCLIAQKPLCGVEMGPNDTSVSAFQVLVTSISHCPSRTKNPSCIYRRSESMVWNMLNLSLFLPVLFTWFLGQRFADVMNLANFNWTLSSNANSTINFPSAGPSSPY